MTMTTGWTNVETEVVHTCLTFTRHAIDRVDRLLGTAGAREIDRGGRIAAVADALESVIPESGLVDEDIDWTKVDWQEIAEAFVQS